MKLCIIANETGAVASHRLEIVRAAAARGWDVTVVAKFTTGLPELAAEATLIDLDLKCSQIAPLEDARAQARLRQTIANLQPQVVHCLTLKPSVYGGAAARQEKVPGLVVSINGLGQSGWLMRVMILQLLRYALGHPNAHLICQNRHDLEAVQRATGTEAATTLLPGSGVDLDYWSPGPEPANPRPIVVMPARLIWNKGVREFVRASTRLAGFGCSAEFRLVGGVQPDNRGGVPERWIRTMCAGDANLCWSGHRDDMLAVYRAADIVALPTHGGEGVPKALQEAMACGKPIVTTDVAGCNEIVQNGYNGLLVAPRDYLALTLAIWRLAGCPEERAAFGARSRQLAVHRFGLDRIIAAHLAIYEDAARGAPVGRPQLEAL